MVVLPPPFFMCAKPAKKNGDQRFKQTVVYDGLTVDFGMES